MYTYVMWTKKPAKRLRLNHFLFRFSGVSVLLLVFLIVCFYFFFVFIVVWLHHRFAFINHTICIMRLRTDLLRKVLRLIQVLFFFFFLFYRPKVLLIEDWNVFSICYWGTRTRSPNKTKVKCKTN